MYRQDSQFSDISLAREHYLPFSLVNYFETIIVVYLIFQMNIYYRCDRILWRGEGFEQLSYIRGESRFSDHRPVCAVFSVEVDVLRSKNNRFRKGYSCAAPRLEYDECMPQRHSFYEF